MKQLSNAFIQALMDDEREYLAYATIQLMDDTVLSLTNEEIWSGGFRYEEAVSDDNRFTAIGSAIMGSASLTINNIYEDYSDYDFTNARVSLSLGMVNAEDTIRIGEYKVDDTNYNGATIQLALLDNMAEFDRPYSLSTLTYPANLQRIVYDACLNCGISAAHSAINFPNGNFVINTRPTEEDITFRDIISWSAALAGCFAKINTLGELEFKWFDVNALGAIDVTTPAFHPWEDNELYSSSGVHYLYSLTSQNICTDDVIITGVTVRVKTEENEETESDILSYSYDSSGYVPGELENDGSEYIILVEDNPFITKTNAVQIVTFLGTQLVGIRFRKLNITQISDPAIESGDVAIVTDRKLNSYKTLVTRNAFSIGASQTIVCGADTPSRSNSSTNSEITKSYIEARKLFKKSMSATDDALNSAILAAQAAHEAQESADWALESARSANNSANSALTQLSVVEDVAGTLNWIRENGTFVQTTDVHLNPTTVYFTYENGEYIPVVAPDINVNPMEQGWYVLDVTSSQSEYIMAHLAVTDMGLWVLPFNTLSPHPLVDSADYNLIDSNENQLVDWSKDPQNAGGYKALFASDGMTIYDSTGTSVAHYGTTTTIGAEMGKHVYIDTDSVDIKDGEDTLASFSGNGLEIYDDEGKIAEFIRRSEGSLEKAALNFPIGEKASWLDPYEYRIDPWENDTVGRQHADIDTGVFKSVYSHKGIYNNGRTEPVGHIEPAINETSTISSGQWWHCQEFPLTEGIWLVTFGASFSANANGDRWLVFGTNNPPTTSTASRYDIVTRPSANSPTAVHATRIVKVPYNAQGYVMYYLYAYQTSGSNLTLAPYVTAVRLV